jgi:hypothetical protein
MGADTDAFGEGGGHGVAIGVDEGDLPAGEPQADAHRRG